jgi:hypothetical protein
MSDTGVSDMAGAVEAAFSAASSPDAAPTTTTETQPASAVETPVEDVSQDAAPPTETTPQTEPGPIPYPRFKEVNDKWTTASKELEGLGWAKGVNPQHAQSAIQLLQRVQQNPLAFTEELETLRDHPTFGPQLRSWAARTLGFRNQPRQEAPVEDVMPEPDVVFEDGRKTYSDQQLQKRDQWLMRQMESKVTERLAPLEKRGERFDKAEAVRIETAIRAKADVEAATEIDSLKQQYPQFEEHKADVADAMEANPSYTLKQAWAEVFVNKVGPKLASGQAAAVRQKVNAGSANPSRPSGAAPTAAKDFHEELSRLLS